MKNRILPTLALTFGILLCARAISISSDALAAADAGNSTASYAKEASDKGQTGDKMTQPADAQAHDASQSCLSPDIALVLASDREKLETRAHEIEAREAALNAIETKLKSQMLAIKEAKASLDTDIQILEQAGNADLQHLVGMYQTMKPKQAAEIFNSMDPAFAAGFLREMNSEKAGLIMAQMDARKSYAISVIIAGRNAKHRKI